LPAYQIDYRGECEANRFFVTNFPPQCSDFRFFFFVDGSSMHAAWHVHPIGTCATRCVVSGETDTIPQSLT